MIWHPALLTVLVLDAAGAIFLLAAAIISLQVATGWRPQVADHRQLKLESRSEVASLAGRGGFLFLGMATLILVAAISNLLAPLVPGAMCGTGVLQAAGPVSNRALALRLAAVTGLWIWHTAESANRRLPQGDGSPYAARFLLLAVPAAWMAICETAAGISALDGETPVRCCALVYQEFQKWMNAAGRWPTSNDAWLFAAGFFSFALLAILISMRISLSGRRRIRYYGLPAAVGLLFCIAATVVLVRVLSPYHYGVLHHHCPWCLFLPQHGLVGYPLFGILLLIFWQTISLGILGWLTSKEPAMEASNTLRQYRISGQLLVWTGVFLALATGPALHYRWAYGVWLH